MSPSLLHSLLFTPSAYAHRCFAFLGPSRAISPGQPTGAKSAVAQSIPCLPTARRSSAEQSGPSPLPDRHLERLRTSLAPSRRLGLAYGRGQLQREYASEVLNPVAPHSAASWRPRDLWPHVRPAQPIVRVLSEGEPLVMPRRLVLRYLPKESLPLVLWNNLIVMEPRSYYGRGAQFASDLPPPKCGLAQPDSKARGCGGDAVTLRERNSKAAESPPHLEAGTVSARHRTRGGGEGRRGRRHAGTAGPPALRHRAGEPLRGSGRRAGAGHAARACRGAHDALRQGARQAAGPHVESIAAAS